MLFYCPNCRQEREAEPGQTVTTKSNRVAYKANCPVCDQDMAEFVSETPKNVPNAGDEAESKIDDK